MKNVHCRICGRELFPEILLELKNILQPTAGMYFVMDTFFPGEAARILREDQIKEEPC